jgi:hypothetical protein
MEELMDGNDIKRVRRSRMRKSMSPNAAKAADVLEDVFKLIGDKGSLTLPVEAVLAMGLPGKCKGGKITNDEVLDANEGTRHCEFDKDGISYSFAYNEGPNPFGPQKMIDITVEGVFH